MGFLPGASFVFSAVTPSIVTSAELNIIPEMICTVAHLHALAETVVPSKCPLVCLLIYLMPFQLHTSLQQKTSPGPLSPCT